MKTLWAPWRMAHVSGHNRDQGCIFCFPPQVRHDKKRLLLVHDGAVAILLNRFPYTNGHLLIAPSRHVGELGDLTAEEKLALMEGCDHAIAILTEAISPQGFNVGFNLGTCAGAGIPDHLHMQVVPRWDGDHNFMAVLAEARVIPEHIDTTYDRLLPLFQTRFPATKQRP